MGRCLLGNPRFSQSFLRGKTGVFPTPFLAPPQFAFCMKKKILFLITKANWGGAQRYVYDLATHLPKDEFAVSVAYGTPGRLLEMLKEKSIATHPLSALGRDIAFWSDIKSFVQLIQLFRRERPDIVHLNSSKAAALGALAARLCGIKRIVFTVHGWPFKEDRNFMAKALIHFISWFTALLAHTTIVVSKTDETIGKRLLLIGKKIHYVPLGIENIFFARTEELLKLTQVIAAFEHPKMASWQRVVTIGELTANKGQAIAINAVAQLKTEGVDVTYILVGSGEDAPDLQGLANKLGVIDRVNFVDFLPDNASRFLRAFDIFLLPSIKEGMPYVLLEASAAGLPIITTDVVNPEFIERATNVHTVPPGNPEAIVATIKEVISEKKQREPLPREDHFLLSKMVEETAKLYY